VYYDLVDKIYRKIAIYSNFPITPTPGYIKFFNEIFTNNDYVCIDVNNPKSAEFAISFNHTKNNLTKIINSGIPIKNRILVMLECKQILPEMHSDKVLSQYGIILSPSLHWAKTFNPVLFNYPFHLETPLFLTPLWLRRYKFGLIQRNNFSCVKGELYTLRRQLIKARQGQMEVRGEGWDKPKIFQVINYIKIIRYYRHILKISEINLIPRYLVKNANYLPVNDKQKFLDSVMVAIVIENAADYISEKLFDCFRAGTVPIYVGPSLEDFGIPEDCVIRSEANLRSLIHIMDHISEFDLVKIRENGSRFLLRNASKWSEENAMFGLAQSIIHALK
jgi:hypothetical protein